MLITPEIGNGNGMSMSYWDGERSGLPEAVKLLSRVRLFAIPWTGAYQAPPSMEFSRQEYWSDEHQNLIYLHGLIFSHPSGQLNISALKAAQCTNEELRP